ncbi:MAG: hypothetical protein AAGG81_08855, partial [Chlamydiota bacterium]
MIVKTFIGEDTKEIEKRIIDTYGPDAIILTSIEITPGQIEVNFGVEEEDFVNHQKRIKTHEKGEDSLTLTDDCEEVCNGFWDEDTIPDVEYIATTNSSALEESINSKISSLLSNDRTNNLKEYLQTRGISASNFEKITQMLTKPTDLQTITTQEESELLEVLASLIHCSPANEAFSDHKLITVDSIDGVETSSVAKKLMLYLQNHGKSVRAALFTEEHKKSQEFDIIQSWGELNDYINNYIHKCDHLLILCHKTSDFLRQWPSTHVLHYIHALWKPSDIQSYLKKQE